MGEGVGKFLIFADKGGRGFWNPQFLADKIFEQPPSYCTTQLLGRYCTGAGISCRYKLMGDSTPTDGLSGIKVYTYIEVSPK